MQLHLAVEIGRVGKEGAGDAAAWHAPRQRLHLDDMAPPEVAIHQHVLPWTWRLSGCRMLLMPFMLVGGWRVAWVPCTAPAIEGCGAACGLHVMWEAVRWHRAHLYSVANMASHLCVSEPVGNTVV